MRILLVNNRHFKQNTHHKTEELAAKLEARGIEVAVDDGGINYRDYDFDNIIVLGGDGTLLRAARTYGTREIPVLVINMGTVGFLSSIELEDVDQYLDSFLKGNYLLEKMMMLEICIYEEDKHIESAYCLNEIVVRACIPRMVDLTYSIDGQVQESLRGDGLIVATPTGSTAYSLSAGGPVVDPQLEAMIITPLAAHTPGKFPLVIAADKEIYVMPPDLEDVRICLDGQVVFRFEHQYHIKIKKSKHAINLVNLKKSPYISTINNRLKKMEGLF